jgi:hypothetical protein
MQRNAKGERVIHYTELAALPPDHPLHEENELYRREVARLLAEGHEGRFVMIKGSEIIGIFNTFREARDEQSRRYFVLRQPSMVQQIQEWEPVLSPIQALYAAPNIAHRS